MLFYVKKRGRRRGGGVGVGRGLGRAVYASRIVYGWEGLPCGGRGGGLVRVRVGG